MARITAATDQSASWQEGDWNGDDRFDRADVVMALQNGSYGQASLATSTEQAAERGGPFVAIGLDGGAGDDQTSIVYDVGTGELSLDAPAGVELTSINVDSAAGIFSGNAAESLGGSFDNDADGNIFKATFGGSFGSLSFGNVARQGLAEEFIVRDLTVVGSLAGGGELGNVDLVYVPEPMSSLLLCIAAPHCASSISDTLACARARLNRDCISDRAQRIDLYMPLQTTRDS